MSKPVLHLFPGAEQHRAQRLRAAGHGAGGAHPAPGRRVRHAQRPAAGWVCRLRPAPAGIAKSRQLVTTGHPLHRWWIDCWVPCCLVPCFWLHAGVTEPSTCARRRDAQAAVFGLVRSADGGAAGGADGGKCAAGGQPAAVRADDAGHHGRRPGGGPHRAGGSVGLQSVMLERDSCRYVRDQRPAADTTAAANANAWRTCRS